MNTGASTFIIESNLEKNSFFIVKDEEKSFKVWNIVLNEEDFNISDFIVSNATLVYENKVLLSFQSKNDDIHF